MPLLKLVVPTAVTAASYVSPSVSPAGTYVGVKPVYEFKVMKLCMPLTPLGTGSVPAAFDHCTCVPMLNFVTESWYIASAHPYAGLNDGPNPMGSTVCVDQNVS